MFTPNHMDVFQYLTRRVDMQKGIGEKHANALTAYMARQKKHTSPHYRATFKDLLFHLPFDYIDRRNITPIRLAQEGIQTLKVQVLKHIPAGGFTRGRSRSAPSPYRVQCEDATGSLMLVFFRANGEYLQKQLPVGQEVIISGALQRYDGIWQMTHPDLITTPEKAAEACVLDAVYSTTEGISSKMFSRWIRTSLQGLPDAPEWIQPSTLTHHHWQGFSESLRQLHLPDEMEQVAKAKARLAYDEALAGQLAMLLLRYEQQKQAGIPFPLLGNTEVQHAIHHLPFTLTEGQQQVLQEMEADMLSGKRMLRLLQGDVGAGKTVVAALAMLATVKAGFQAAIMAPTEILARQHMESIDSLLGLLDVPVIFLAGSLTQKQREEARERIRQHPAALIIGTHALFQEGVEFANLGMVVIDEQHRFGVAQRLALSEKGAHPPHMLLMTATPIPRSLAMTYYGDLDVSLLIQKPEGRQAIDTRTIPLSKLPELLEGIGRALQQGEKIYWICPLVEDSITDNAYMAGLQAAEARRAALEVLFPHKTGIMHGKMPMSEREPVMQAFLKGEIRLLVATTVVEVGVNVPDATIMVIENAERFGLAQLHQLRGRVGRSDKASRCILLYQSKCSATARERLKTMRDTNDGFVIAEADLRLRGGGDILGTRQTGMPDFTFLNVEKDTALLAAARQEAKLVLHDDPQLQSQKGKVLRQLLTCFERDEAVKFLRSG